MNAQQIVKTGDVVILTKGYDKRPETANVGRVTKSGQFYVVTLDGESNARFKFDWRGTAEPVVGPRSYSPNKQWIVHLFSEEKMAELNRTADELEARKKVEDEAKAKRLQEIEDRKAAEMAEVKDAVGNLYYRMQDQLPDGSRLYVINMPVKECYRESKVFEVMIVRCKNEKRLNFTEGKEEEVVEAAYTYTNAQTSSFSSCSTYRTETDLDAIWEAVCDQYHRW